jgi:xkdN-like protein
MSNLSAFLKPAYLREEKEITFKRFVDENGNPVPFRVRSLTQEENEQITKASLRVKKGKGGATQEQLDNGEYTRRIIVAGTVEPDFSSRELCEAYGTLDPLQVPAKMLLSGEFATLLKAITELSGFDADSPEDEAKNS